MALERCNKVSSGINPSLDVWKEKHGTGSRGAFSPRLGGGGQLLSIPELRERECDIEGEVGSNG